MKWIMVNILNNSEFACQILNRDLWSDKEVQRTIREHFYFLQVSGRIGDDIDSRSLHLKNLKEDDINKCTPFKRIPIQVSSTHAQVNK